MLFSKMLVLLNATSPCVWVAVASVRGSAPREEGAGMLVTASEVIGTVGGGHLELKAIELAREWLRLGKHTATARHYPLGPALGQCCGGAVDLLFRPVTEGEREWVEALARAEREAGDWWLATQTDSALPAAAPHTRLHRAVEKDLVVDFLTRHVFSPWHIWVFGAGHVGRALVQVFSTLPCVVTWVDSRDAEFPGPDFFAEFAQNASALASENPADEVKDIPAGADVLVLTHSHALDLDIVRTLLQRDDLHYTGMIGSATKAALFRRRLAERGCGAARIDALVCPIGAKSANAASAPGLDKHPGAIAVSVAADLLARRAASASRRNHAEQHAGQHADVYT